MYKIPFAVDRESHLFIEKAFNLFIIYWLKGIQTEVKYVDTYGWAMPGQHVGRFFWKFVSKKEIWPKYALFVVQKLIILYFYINMNPPFIFSFILLKSMLDFWKRHTIQIFFQPKRIHKVALDRCVFNAYCPMGNPVTLNFLMGIARLCPCYHIS